jgi:long-chain acyl-CoA synthetase
VRASLEYCGALVDAGWSILIFPEGTRSATGELQRFRSGIGLLAKELRVPVVPVAIEGTHGVLPKGCCHPQPGPVTVRIGAPLTIPSDADYAEAAALLEKALLHLVRRS